MGNVKSKGERLNWPFVSEIRKVDTRTLFNSVKGKVLSQEEVDELRGNSFNANKLLVP